MEKQVKLKNKFLKFLPKPTSMVSFQNPTYSPTRSSDKRLDIVTTAKTHAGRGFAGLGLPMIPPEARRKSKNSNFEAQEPTSPKVSCIGQIKHKKKLKKEKAIKRETQQHVYLPRNVRPVSAHEPNKKSSNMKKLFSGGGAKVPGRKSDASSEKTTTIDKAPSLSKMKRFASGRETFTTNFDWTTQVAPLGPGQNCYSDDESFDEHDVIIPFSAPIPMGGYRNGDEIELKPKKEINIWKRRTMSQPTPLQIT